MIDSEKERVKSYEIKTIKYNIPCKCGRGNMVGTGIVRLVDNKYQHHHACVYFDASTGSKNGCGLEEWFSDKYPLRENREISITL
jgi:hypothetical protein